MVCVSGVCGRGGIVARAAEPTLERRVWERRREARALDDDDVRGDGCVGGEGDRLDICGRANKAQALIQIRKSLIKYGSHLSVRYRTQIYDEYLLTNSNVYLLRGARHAR